MLVVSALSNDARAALLEEVPDMDKIQQRCLKPHHLLICLVTTHSSEG